MIKHYVRNIATDIPYIMLFYSEVFSSTNLRPNQDTLNESKHSKKCTFYTLRFGCSFAAVNTIKPQLL